MLGPLKISYFEKFTMLNDSPYSSCKQIAKCHQNKIYFKSDKNAFNGHTLTPVPWGFRGAQGSALGGQSQFSLNQNFCYEKLLNMIQLL